MFIKDKLTKGALKLDTKFEIDTGETGAKPSGKEGYNSLKYISKGKSSIEFDGTDSIIEGTANHFKLGTSDFSISCWFYIADSVPVPPPLPFPASGTQISVLSKYVDDNNYWTLEVGVAEFGGGFNTATGYVNFHSVIGGVANAGGNLFGVGNPSNQLTVGWHHLVVTNDRSEAVGGMNAYIDGSTVLATDGFFASRGGTADLNIDALATIGLNVGRNSNGQANRRTRNEGQIADLRSYDKVLTPAEVAKLYKETFRSGADAGRLKKHLVEHITFGDRDDKISGKELKKILLDTVSIHGFRTTAKSQKAVGSHRSRRPTELVTNQTFESNLNGWTQSGSDWSQSSEKAICSATSKKLSLDGITSKSGHTYIFKADVAQVSGTSGYVRPIMGTTQGALITSLPTTINISIRAPGLDISLISVVIGSSTVSVDNVSIQEVPTTEFIPKNFASTAFKKRKIKGGIIV